MVVAAPDVPQHLSALHRANTVRLARAELKREIAEGGRTVASVLLDVPWEAATMTVCDLLMTQHRWGRQRAVRLLNSLPLTESKPIEALTERQRDSLIARLQGTPCLDPWSRR